MGRRRLWRTVLFGIVRPFGTKCPEVDGSIDRKSEENMIFVSTDQGTFEFQSVDDAINFVQVAAKKKDTLWVTGDELYPCVAVCTNEPYLSLIHI